MRVDAAYGEGKERNQVRSRKKTGRKESAERKYRCISRNFIEFQHSTCQNVHAPVKKPDCTAVRINRFSTFSVSAKLVRNRENMLVIMTALLPSGSALSGRPRYLTSDHYVDATLKRKIALDNGLHRNKFCEPDGGGMALIQNHLSSGVTRTSRKSTSLSQRWHPSHSSRGRWPAGTRRGFCSW
jgi:hypothetical protein